MKDYKIISENSFLYNNETGDPVTENIKVCRVSVPTMPDPIDDVVISPIGAALCIYKFETGWAFVKLSGAQKVDIANALINAEIPIDEWADVVVEPNPKGNQL